MATQDARREIYLLPTPATDPRKGGAVPSSTLIRFTEKGAIKSFGTTIRLNKASGHTYEFKQGGRTSLNISARGYDHINLALSMSFFLPPVITGEDGNPHCNPHVERDELGAVKRVRIRCIGRVRNATGNWVLHDSTLYYDLEPMLAQSVLKKWRGKSGDKPKDWGELYSSENLPPEVKEDPHKKCILIPGGYVLAIELKGEVVGLVADHSHLVNFATRRAETIVKRNLLARAVGLTKLDPSTMSVNVVSWPQADVKSIEQIESMVRRVEAGELTAADGRHLELDRTSDIVATIEADPEPVEHDEDSVDREEEPPELVELKTQLASTYKMVLELGLTQGRHFKVAEDVVSTLKGLGFDGIQDAMLCVEESKLRNLLEGIMMCSPKPEAKPVEKENPIDSLKGESSPPQPPEDPDPTPVDQSIETLRSEAGSAFVSIESFDARTEILSACGFSCYNQINECEDADKLSRLIEKLTKGKQ